MKLHNEEILASIEQWAECQIVTGDATRERCGREVLALLHPDQAVQIPGEEAIA